MNELEQLQELADRVVSLVEARGRDLDATVEANVRASRTRHGLTRFANSFIHQHVGEDTVTVALTLAVDARTSPAATTAVDDHALEQLVTTGLVSARLQPVDPYWPGATPPAEVTGSGHLDTATAQATPDERATLVKAFVDAAPDLEAAGFVDTELDRLA